MHDAISKQIRSHRRSYRSRQDARMPSLFAHKHAMVTHVLVHIQRTDAGVER